MEGDSDTTSQDDDHRKKWFKYDENMNIIGQINDKEIFCEYEEVTVGMCSNFDQSNCVCMVFHHSVGFQNLWIGFAVWILFCLLLSTIYSFLICCKFSHLKYVLKWHIGIFIANITIWFWVPCIIFNSICQVHFVCGWYVLSFPLVLICLVFSVLDMYYSPEAKYFRNQKQAEETSEFLERMQAAKPAVGVKIECFHYETRIRSNSNRRNSDSARARTVEKITFRERRLFPIDGFLDVSQIPSRIDISGVTLFQISKSVTPGDRYSQDAFHQFKNRYIAANNHRDQAMHTHVEVVIPDLTADSVMTVSGAAPWWASRCWFYVLSCLQMSFLLRILFTTRTTVFSIVIEKKYFVDPTVQRSYDFDTGLGGSQVVNNFIMTPQQGYGQPQQMQQGEGNPQQYPQGEGYLPVQPQFCQPGVSPNQEKKSKAQSDDLPPTYDEHHKFKTMS